MALIVTDPIGAPIDMGGRYLTIRQVAFDASYPTGGESLTFGQLGFAAAPDLVRTRSKSGFLFEYDKATQKLKALASVRKYTATHNPASLAATTARDDAIAVTGVLTTDECIGCRSGAAAEAGITVEHGRCSADNEITVRLNNPSAGAVDMASQTFTFYVIRRNGAGQEVADTTDLSALTGVEIETIGQHLA